MRLFRAEIRKLVRRPATWVTVVILMAIVALLFIAVGATITQNPDPEQRAQTEAFLRFPGAYRIIVGFVAGLGGLLAVIYGASIAGAEWPWGTLKTVVARGESRARYVLVKFAAVALMLAVMLVLAFAAGTASAVAGASLGGLPLTGIDDPDTLRGLPELLAKGWLGLVEQAAIGYVIAMLARSQLAGIGAGIALYFVEQFSTIVLRDAVQYLPFSVSGSLISDGGGGGGPGGGPGFEPLDPALALGLTLLYGVLALLVATIFVERAEITG